MVSRVHSDVAERSSVDGALRSTTGWLPFPRLCSPRQTQIDRDQRGRRENKQHGEDDKGGVECGDGRLAGHRLRQQLFRV
jgi:hypothetical protein